MLDTDYNEMGDYECRDDFWPGYNSKGQERESLPNGTYHGITAEVTHESKMTTVNISGDGNTLMARVDTVNNEYGPVYVINVPSSKGGFIQERVEAFNPDFYNLIVVGDEDLNETNHFLLDKTRVITESTSQELKMPMQH